MSIVLPGAVIDIEPKSQSDYVGRRTVRVDGKAVGFVAYRQQYRSRYGWELTLHNGGKATFETLKLLRQHLPQLLKGEA